MDSAISSSLAQLPLLLSEGVPQVTGPYILQIVSRVLHILSAMILVGGLFYIRTVLSPAGEDACFAGRRPTWAKWVGMATALLVLSGVYNLMVIMDQAKAAGAELPKQYHMFFGIKVLLALLVMFVAAILAGKTSAAERFRANMGKWLKIGWMASIAIVVLAAILKSFH